MSGLDWKLIFAAATMLGLVLLIIVASSKQGSLNNIKLQTVGNGQHGTARWATPAEIRRTYARVPFQPKSWRKGENLPTKQGLIVGSAEGRDLKVLVDCDDIHCLMIGASGVGKTAFFLYPNIEYACASGMSYFAMDTKGDLARNYGTIAKKYYGYRISVIDLRNPTRSDGNNLLTLINRYMDLARMDADDLASRAKAEKYAKILSKSIINPDAESSYGQNAYFYDAAEGLLTAVVLLLLEYLPPSETDGKEVRHIVSVFKLVQELLETTSFGKSRFQLLILAAVFLVFTGLGILVPLAFQGLRQLRHRQVEIAGPYLVIQGMRAYHLVHREQPVQAGITDAGVQRPLVLFELLCHPTKDALAAANPMVSARMLPVGLVDGLAVLCRVAGFPALIALTRRCAAPQLVCYGGR